MSVVNLQRGHNKKQAIKELMSIFLFATATNSIVNVLFSRWQGFDEDEEGYASMVKAFSNDLVANTLGLIPFAQAAMGTSIAAMTDTYNFKPGHPAFEALKDGQRAKEKARQAMFVKDSGVTANEAFADMSTYMLEWIIGAPTSAIKKYKRIYGESFMD